MWSEGKGEQILRKALPTVCYAAILSGIYLIELHSYLLFHTIIELFSVCVACAIFMIVWNSRHFIQNNYVLFLGVAYFFVGGLDLLHALAYQGMGVFPDHDANLPTQLWIVTRYLESLSLLLAPLFLKRRLNGSIVLAVYGLLSSVVLLSIFAFRIFPVCFRAPTGLTAFKVTSEFIIIGILLLSLIALLLNKSWFDVKVLRWLIWSIALTMASEFVLTLYVTPEGHANMIGHLLKLISFYLMYKALIETGMKQPHTLLYSRLKEHEAELQEARDALETQVQKRTAELSKTVDSLKNEVQERLRAEEAYREKEAHLRTVVSGAPVIFFATDEHGTITVSEGKGLATLGQAPGESVGSNVFERYRKQPDIVENMRRALRGEEVAAEIEVIPGKIFDVRYAPVHNDDNHLAGVMGVAVDITETRQAQKAVLAHQEQLRALTSQLLSVEDQERRKIATALHDSVGQILAFLKIELGTLQRLELPEKAAQAIAHAREQVEEAVRQTRTLTFEISPPELYALGLESALEELAQRFSRERHIECQVHGGSTFGPLSNQLKTLLYRAVRELLTNAAKHAHARTIDVELGPIDGCIQIAVKDDGTGFDVSHIETRSSDKGTGFGLLSIHERLTHLGGRMDIHSAPGEGTEVILTVPFEHMGTSDGSTMP